MDHFLYQYGDSDIFKVLLFILNSISPIYKYDLSSIYKYKRNLIFYAYTSKFHLLFLSKIGKNQSRLTINLISFAQAKKNANNFILSLAFTDIARF